VIELPLAAWRGLAARFCAFDLPLADIGEDGAGVLVLDDAGLRNLPQLVKGGVKLGRARGSGSLAGRRDHPLPQRLDAKI
jgi:hypothetical protein